MVVGHSKVDPRGGGLAAVVDYVFSQIATLSFAQQFLIIEGSEKEAGVVGESRGQWRVFT